MMDFRIADTFTDSLARLTGDELFNELRTSAKASESDLSFAG